MLNDLELSSPDGAWANGRPRSIRARQVDCYYGAAMRALELAYYLDRPDLPAIRTLALVVTHKVVVGPTTDYVAEGCVDAVAL